MTLKVVCVLLALLLVGGCDPGRKNIIQQCWEWKVRIPGKPDRTDYGPPTTRSSE